MTILFLIYLVLGYKSIGYCKHYIFGIEYEMIGSITNHFIKTLVEGVFLGWLTIPIMILHCLFSR